MKCLSLVSIVACACATTTAPPPPPPAAPTPTPATEPHEQPKPSAIWPPPGYVEPKCELELSTSLKRLGAAYELTAIAKNISDRPLTFDLPDRCPQGPIAFAGLPNDYDYYRSCTKGACAGPRKPIPISVAPGASVELARAEINPAGANCTPELPSGRYSISFGLATTVRSCAGPFASLEHKGSAARPAKPSPAAPAKQCPPMPACGIACPGGRFAHDENGCSLCGCEKLDGVMAPR